MFDQALDVSVYMAIILCFFVLCAAFSYFSEGCTQKKKSYLFSTKSIIIEIYSAHVLYNLR